MIQADDQHTHVFCDGCGREHEPLEWGWMVMTIHMHPLGFSELDMRFALENGRLVNKAEETHLCPACLKKYFGNRDVQEENNMSKVTYDRCKRKFKPSSGEESYLQDYGFDENGYPWTEFGRAITLCKDCTDSFNRWLKNLD